jgi:hypothetical protein
VSQPPESVPLPFEGEGEWMQWEVSAAGDITISKVTRYKSQGGGVQTMGQTVLKIPAHAIRHATENARTPGGGVPRKGRID